jgi:DNA-directed RNA polymerase specialized sigma24 family protein
VTDSPHDTKLQGSCDERFGRTQWSQVLRAADPAAEGFGPALQGLCRTYWYPLYAFVRRSGHSPQDAEDLTQAFFARLLDKNYLASADQEKGRFRTFLLVALKRFLANEWERQHAIKRGGFATVVAIDQQQAETLYGGDLAHHEQPDVLLEKQWAMTLIGQVTGRLQAEYVESGRGELFGYLRASLTRDDPAIGYAEIAERVGTSTAAVKMAAMRLRERYQVVLREEIARTVASPDEIDDEIRHLFTVFSR